MKVHRYGATLLVAGALILAGCGGSPAGGGADTGSAAVDGTALDAIMPGFATEVFDEFGQVGFPIYVDHDKVLLGFLPTGDAVKFCERLSAYVAAKGFVGVPISIVANYDAPALATGSAGGGCQAA